MSTEVLTVPPDKNLNFAEVLAEAGHVRHLPVVENGRVVAMLSTRDILSHFSKAGASHFVAVKELMNPSVQTIEPDKTLEELALVMHECNISGVPVVSDGELVGIVTERDFLKVFLKP